VLGDLRRAASFWASYSGAVVDNAINEATTGVVIYTYIPKPYLTGDH